MAIGVAQNVGATTLAGAGATTITQSITVSSGSRVWAFAVGSLTGTASFSGGTKLGGGTASWSTAVNTAALGAISASSLSEQLDPGTYTITCTFTASATSRGLVLVEVTGADNNAPQDHKGQEANFTNATDNVATPSMTASGQPCLLLGAVRSTGDTTVAAGTGFTGGTLYWGGSGDANRPEWKRDTSTGTKTCTWTAPNSGGWFVHGIIIGEASAGLTAPPDNQDTSRRRSPRRQLDQPQMLPLAPASPWVFVDQPRIVRSRRQLPQSADPVPPLAPAALGPPVVVPEQARARPRRAELLRADPVPPLATASIGPPPDQSFVARAVRRIVNLAREAIGLPPLVSTPVGPTLPPPFTTTVDPVVLSTWVDSVTLTVAVDPVRLSTGERMKPRMTTDTYPITNTLLSNGVAVNLTGYTVTINIWTQDMSTQKRANGACTVTDAANGKVSYTPAAGDVDTAGGFWVQWKAVAPGGTPYHFPSDGYDPLEIKLALG